jgi:hypothetical protein
MDDIKNIYVANECRLLLDARWLSLRDSVLSGELGKNLTEVVFPVLSAVEEGEAPRAGTAGSLKDTHLP